MAPRSRVTRETILERAAKLISETGAASLTFQALGESLGVSKQAIIYWFPSKSDLTRELVVPALELEAQAVTVALRRTTSARKAIEVFLRALIAFHLADLGRFRLIYVTGQFDTQVWQVAEVPEVAMAIHEATSKMYGALESVLAKAPDVVRPGVARQTAVAAHMAAIGLLTMLSLADAVHDPMAHDHETLIDALVLLATGSAIKPRTVGKSGKVAAR